jgi:YD repeat-containing protein
VDQLYSIAAGSTGPAGMLRVYGSGGYDFSTGTTSFTSPAGDNGTLTLSGSTYTYSTPDGQTWTFNSSGYETQWTSADGQETLQYRYDGSNRLSGVTAIDGALTTISYGTSTVTLQTVNSRTTTLTLDGSNNLTGIANPDGGLQTLTYDGNHRLTEQQFGLLQNNWAYSSAGTLGTYTRRMPVRFSMMSWASLTQRGGCLVKYSSRETRWSSRSLCACLGASARMRSRPPSR